MVALLLTLALATAAYAVWFHLVWLAYGRLALWLWWHSYRLDAWIERAMEVPEDQRRFS